MNAPMDAHAQRTLAGLEQRVMLAKGAASILQGIALAGSPEHLGPKIELYAQLIHDGLEAGLTLGAR